MFLFWISLTIFLNYLNYFVFFSAAARPRPPPRSAAAISRFSSFSAVDPPPSSATSPHSPPRHLRAPPGVTAPPRTQFLRRAAANSISAVAASRTAARRFYRLHMQVNLPELLIRSTDHRRAPPSPASNSNLNRARPSNSGDGGSNRRCQRVPLLAAELEVQSRSAAVVPIAGEDARGRRPKFKSKRAAGADPTR